MLHIAPEEAFEDERHDKQGQERGEQTPNHAEVCILIFLLEIALYKLGEKEGMFLHLFYHKYPSSLHVLAAVKTAEKFQ